MKKSLPAGLTEFPRFTRFGEENWNTVAPNGLIVCPDHCGAWSGFLTWVEEESCYRLKVGTKFKGPPFVPYIETDDLKKAIDSHQTRMNVMIDEVAEWQALKTKLEA